MNGLKSFLQSHVVHPGVAQDVVEQAGPAHDSKAGFWRLAFACFCAFAVGVVIHLLDQSAQLGGRELVLALSGLVLMVLATYNLVRSAPDTRGFVMCSILATVAGYASLRLLQLLT